MPIGATSSTRPGNNSRKKKTKKPAKKQRPVSRSDPTKSWSAEQFVQAADHALHLHDPEQAVALYTIALEKATTAGDAMNRDSCLLPADILEKRAAVKVSLDDPQSALTDYFAALEYLAKHGSDNNNRDPSTGSPPVELVERRAGLHLYVGQLLEGKDALSAYQQGLECWRAAVILRERDASAPPSQDVSGTDHAIPATSPLNETQKQLATAHCTIAELYLTDLCCEEGAEQACESHILQALQYQDPVLGQPLVDALQTAASLRLSQQRADEAVEFMARAYKQMQVGCEALAALVGMRNGPSYSTQGLGGNGSDLTTEAMELVETEAVQSLPGFEFRCQTAKLLLECAVVLKQQPDILQEAGHENDLRVATSVEAAINVIGSLMAENDEVVEIWALAGDAFAHIDPPSPELAQYYWDRAIEMLQSVRESLEKNLDEVANDDEEREQDRQLDEVECQLGDLNRKLSEIIGAVNQQEDQPMDDNSLN